jgi:tRNA-2-methylthio-N6-dimethylallyladenosine synthase
VLVEGPSKRNEAMHSGRTRQNKLVHFEPVEDGTPDRGGYATVEVTEAAPHHLRGRLVSVEQARAATVRHQRIPVAVRHG